MSKLSEKFRVLLCGKKDHVNRMRKMILESDEIHLQFASSPTFLIGRALFHPPHIVLINTDLQKGPFQESLKEFIMRYPGIPIFGLSSAANHRETVEFMKLGLTDCFIFPDEYRNLNEQVTILLEEWRNKKKKEAFVLAEQRTYDFSQIIGRSPCLIEVLQRAKKIIESNARIVLVTGETGTGKELFARAIHYNSLNQSSPFVDIACSALPETLLESELFGYEKGAFTDARERKIGLFELAGDGTIFLDEIGDISMATQSKLLKVVENRVTRRLGGLRDVPVKARIIAATSVDLDAKMQSGAFRKDLYHRLKLLPLHIPPLRDRKEDIALLVDAFIRSFNEIYNRRIGGISSAALEKLRQYEWSGNVRELKHTIERAVLLSEDELLETGAIELGEERGTTETTMSSRAETGAQTISLEVSLEDTSLDKIQKTLVQKVLEQVGGNKLKAAQLLHISRPRLDRILKSESDDI